MNLSRPKCLILIFTVTFGACTLLAQSQDGLNILLGKARSLEARGRIDLAAQNWQQVLLVNSSQTEALAGLARYAKETGKADDERNYLDRLRKINPKDPAIEGVEKMHVPTAQERDRLDQAGRLTLQHQPDAAMKIYRDVFGDEPPPGKWAGPFYEAEAASSGGREKAVAQLRRLCARDPHNEVSRLWLALVLTYHPSTRMQGFQLFETIQDPGAVEQAHDPWRQALLWEKENPAVLGPLDAYLKHYPDSELEKISASLHEKQQHDLAETNKERGFQALHNKDLGTAQSKFEEVLRRSPNDSNAIAGLGFVRLNQKRFSEALSLFERARTLAPQRTDVREGYETAKFWLAMQQASVSLQQNNPPAAIAAYGDALAIRPQDEEALLGMAQALLQARRFPDAEARFQQVLLRSPSNVDAKAGLGFVRLKQGQFDDAQKIFAEALRLAPQRKDIDQGYRNARYWGVMKHGAEALNQNRAEVAAADYQQALVLSPDAKDALLGLAQAKERSGKYTEAAQSYKRLTAVDSSDSSGWLGLIHAYLGARDANDAITTLQVIPEATRQQMEKRPDYLAEVALAYYGAHQTAQGDQALRRALDAGGSDTQEVLNARLQLAGILMDQGNIERAIEVYKQATQSHPNSVVAWEGLVGAYTHVRDFSSALAIIRTMPPNARAAVANDTGFLNAEAAAYSATGQCAEAEDFLRRSVTLDHAAGRVPAESTQLLLADILRREGKYDQARQSYREVIDRNTNSADAWRGYITALHNAHADTAVVSESARMSSALRNQLAKDPNFLVLLASAQRSAGNNEQVVQLLEQAKSRYQEQRQVSPADLDLQLAWAMAATKQHDPDLLALLMKAKTRTDLTARQHEAFDDIWSIWSVRRAQQALENHKSEQSTAILLDADRVLPGNRRIQSALGTTYAHQHEYHKALAVYASWRMAGADAGDYRSAAGAALAVHEDSLADQFLQEGLQHWPRDPELLRMIAKQEVAHGKYDDAKRDLKLALIATREPADSNFQHNSKDVAGAEQNTPQVTMAQQGDLANSTSSQSSPATCRTTAGGDAGGEARLGPISYARRGRARLVNAAYVYNGDPQQNQQSQQQSQQSQDGKNDAADPQQSQDRKADAAKEQGIQDEIDVVQNRNTPFTGLGDAVTGRTGDPGFGRLIIEDGAVSDSITFANRVRMTLEGNGVYLLGGRPDGGSTLQFGSLKQGATFGEQKAFGFAGDLQLSTNTFGLDFGTSPQGFLTHNLTGGLRLRPLNGPLTFLFVRDSVKDSLLSYAGARDPLTGQAWGGVVSNAGTLELSHDVRGTGQYVSLTYGFIQGLNVPDNWKVAGTATVYWRVAKGLSVGLSASGMHYDKNLSFFSLGQGGYFSPQQYYVAAIPVSWFARHRRFEYEIRAGLGAQYLSTASSPVFPMQPQLSPSFYAGQVHAGPNYDFAVRVGYRIAPHWYLYTFATGNNAQNFATQTVGFTLRFLMHPLPTNTDLHVNSIPDWRGKQPFGIQ